MPTPRCGDLLWSSIALNPSQVIQWLTLSTTVFFLIADVSLCEESPQVGDSHPYNIDRNETTRVREGIERHASTTVAGTQCTQVKKQAHTHTHTGQRVTAQQVLKSLTQQIRCVLAESRRLRMFNRGLVFCSMCQWLLFIAPRKLGAVGAPFGRQFLPSAHRRTGQSGAPLDMNNAWFLSLFGEANRCTRDPLGTPNTVRCGLMTVGSGHASPVDLALIALLTVGADAVDATNSPVNFSRNIFSDSREQRVHCRASLGTGQCPVHP
jgi:hypothetical protein